MYKIKNFKESLILSFQIAISEFKLKNEGSYLGLLWYLLNPALTFILLFFIFQDRLGNNINNYGSYLLLGIIIFNFFQSTTLEATKNLIKENHFLIKSINISRKILILSIVIKNLIAHLLEILLVFIIFIFLKINLLFFLYYIPILLLLIIFTFGVSLILSSLTVFFVDLDNIWNFTIRLIWLGTPIFYSIEGQLKTLYINTINPLYYFITAARDIIIYNKTPETSIFLGIIIFSLIGIISGLFIFKKLNDKIPELI